MEKLIEHLRSEFVAPLHSPILIFSLILFIILLAPIVLRKINIPGIVGLIISGVIIGPHGLGIIEKNSAVELFSTIGLLYIMFIAGLELDMNEFKSNKYKSIFFGLFTFAIPLGLGFPVMFYGLNYDFNASLLTASMFATHTLVGYSIVSKLGISKNVAVAVAVGGTILTDSAVLILLAVIMGGTHGTLDQSFWVTLGISMAVFLFIMFFIVPRIAKWFFQKLESEKHAHYIFVLSVVFFAAFLAEAAGLESIIGAFVAGLALNRLIPHSSALMNRIEFMGNALFIPFFLISVGMLVDLSSIMKGPAAIIVATALTAAALLGKWLAAAVTQLVFRFSAVQRALIFGLSSAHAAATLAVILVGYNAKILDDNILNGTVILILVTCLVASLVTERAAKKIVLQNDNDVTALPELQIQEHILLPIGQNTNLDKLLELALFIKDKKSPNPVSVLAVVPNNEEAEQNVIKSRQKIESLVKLASASENKVNILTAIDFNVASGISRTSREVMANIVLLGWPNDAGILEKIMGEKIESLVNTSDKNIYIADINRPFFANKSLKIIAPPMAEKEVGFRSWVQKASMIATEVNLPVVLFGTRETFEAFKRVLKKNGIPLKPLFSEFNDWDDFLIIAREIHKDDMMMLVSARKGSVSYVNFFESAYAKLDKFFADNSKIVVYPEVHAAVEKMESFDTVTSEPLSRGIRVVGYLGRAIRKLFGK